jgi:predicted SprT family Zn-dependent metalloprotease
MEFIKHPEAISIKGLVYIYIEQALKKLQHHTKQKLRVDDVMMSKKMTSTMGEAYWEPKNRKNHYIIKISSKIFTQDCKALRDTVYHEVAHIADYQIYKKWGHGKTWKRLMVRLGLEPLVLGTEEEFDDAGFVDISKKAVIICRITQKEVKLEAIEYHKNNACNILDIHL